MSTVPVTKNEIRFIQNDMLSDVKKIEDTLSHKLYNVSEKLNNKETEYDSKFLKFSDNINELLNLFVKRKLDNEKIEELLNMKTKIDEQMTENKTKLAMLSKNLANALYKYDRYILDNMEVPGIIGAGCKFKNCKLFFENVFEELKSVHVLKEQQSTIQKNYQEKLDTVNKKIDIVSSESSEKIKQILDLKIKEFNALLDMRYKDIEILVQQSLFEKNKYIEDLVANQNKRNLEIDNIKLEINDKFEKEVKKFNDILENNKKNYEKQIEEYKEMKKKIDKLMENMKSEKSYQKTEKSAYINRSRPIKNNIEESLSNRNLINMSNNKSNRNEIMQKNSGNTFITTQNEESKLPLISLEKNNNTNNLESYKNNSSGKLNKKVSSISLKKRINKKSNEFSRDNLLQKTNMGRFSPNKNFATKTDNNISNKIKNKNSILSEPKFKINMEENQIKIVKSFVKENSCYSEISSLSSSDSKNHKKSEKLNQKIVNEISKTQYKERGEVANKLKLCSVDYMTHKKDLTLELLQDPINIKNRLTNVSLNKDKNNLINTPTKTGNKTKNLFNTENNVKNKLNMKTASKTIYGKVLFPPHSKFINKNNLAIGDENIPKTPKTDSFPTKNIFVKENNKMNTQTVIKNINNNKKLDITENNNNIINNNNDLTLISKNSKSPIKIKENLKSLKENKLMDIDNSKNRNERIINDKITLLKNNTDILNVRIDTLEEKYFPLLKQMNDTISRVNEIYDEIRRKNDKKKVITPKSTTTNKIIIQEALAYSNHTKTENNKKTNIKLNNTMFGINLNYPKAKSTKNDKEKEKVKNKEIINVNDEIKIKEKKTPTDASNKVLRNVEPFLIKFLKNGK